MAMSPVLQALIQGQQEKEASDQRAFQNEQQLQQQDLQKKQLKEEHDYHTSLLENEAKKFDAEQALQKSQHALAIQQALDSIKRTYVEKGITPSGATFSGSNVIQLHGGDLEGQTVDLPNREDLATQQANLERITGAPKAEFEQEKVNLQNQNKIDLADLTNKAKQALATQQENSTAARAREKAKSDFDREMEVARVRGGYTIQAAQIAAAAGQAKVESKEATLSNEDQKKLDILNNIETSAKASKDLLDKTGYSYFQGPSGILTNASVALGGGESDPTNAAIKTTLGQTLQGITTDEAGKTLSKSERDLIATHIPDTSHFKDPTEAKVQLETLLKSIGDMRAQVYARYAAGNKGTTVAAPKSGTVTVPTTTTLGGKTFVYNSDGTRK